MKKTESSFPYPVYLRLSGRRCLVIGGGKVALQKLQALLAAGADDVRAVALEFLPEFRALAAKSGVKTERRAFRAADARGAQVLVCATNNEELNARAAASADRGALVNVVDRPALCNFIAPAVYRRGPITIAISTGGASPALAKLMRDRVAGLFDAAFARKAGRLGRLRRALLAAKKGGDAAAVKKALAAYEGFLKTF